jgi:hypothetical protein
MPPPCASHCPASQADRPASPSPQVRFLLERGADASARDHYGRRPVDFARAAGCRNMCLLLRQWEREHRPPPPPRKSAPGVRLALPAPGESPGASDLAATVLGGGGGGAPAPAPPSLSEAAARRPPTAAQLRVLERHGVPKQFLPTTRPAAARCARGAARGSVVGAVRLRNRTVTVTWIRWGK